MNGKQKWDELSLEELLNQLQRLDGLSGQSYRIYHLHGSERDLKRSEQLRDESDELKQYIIDKYDYEVDNQETVPLTRDSWDEMINHMFQNVDHETIEQQRQEWLDKGYIKEVQTAFGTLVMWDHKNLPKFEE